MSNFILFQKETVYCHQNDVSIYFRLASAIIRIQHLLWSLWLVGKTQYCQLLVNINNTCCFKLKGRFVFWFRLKWWRCLQNLQSCINIVQDSFLIINSITIQDRSILYSSINHMVVKFSTILSKKYPPFECISWIV